MTEQEVNNLIDSKIGKVKMSQLPEATQTSGLYSIGYTGNQSVKYKANLLQGDPLTVRKTYQTEALALADKNPIDTTTSLPLKVGQFVSIVNDGDKNGIYRIASIDEDGTMSLELQGKLGDLSGYVTKEILNESLNEVDIKFGEPSLVPRRSKFLYRENTVPRATGLEPNTYSFSSGYIKVNEGDIVNAVNAYSGCSFYDEAKSKRVTKAYPAVAPAGYPYAVITYAHNTLTFNEDVWVQIIPKDEAKKIGADTVNFISQELINNPKMVESAASVYDRVESNPKMVYSNNIFNKSATQEGIPSVFTEGRAVGFKSDNNYETEIIKLPLGVTEITVNGFRFIGFTNSLNIATSSEGYISESEAITFDVPEDTYYIYAASSKTTIDTAQISIGSELLPYEPFNFGFEYNGVKMMAEIASSSEEDSFNIVKRFKGFEPKSVSSSGIVSSNTRMLKKILVEDNDRYIVSVDSVSDLVIVNLYYDNDGLLTRIPTTDSTISEAQGRALVVLAKREADGFIDVMELSTSQVVLTKEVGLNEYVNYFSEKVSSIDSLLEDSILHSRYGFNKYKIENDKLKEAIEVQSININSLLKAKVRDENDSQVIQLNRSEGGKLLLGLHKRQNDGYNTYNDAYLPNANNDFSDVRIISDSGEYLPHKTLYAGNIDVLPEERGTLPQAIIHTNTINEMFGTIDRDVSKSSDGGKSWSTIDVFSDLDKPVVAYVSSSNTLFVGKSSVLYRSEYPYTSKTEVLNLETLTGYRTTILSHSMIQHPEGDMFLGTYQDEYDFRIYKSVNDGISWSEVYRAQDYQHVHNMSIDVYQTPIAIYAGLDNWGGVMKTIDKGATWEELRGLHPNMPQSTDYGVIYADESGYRLLGGETSLKTGGSIIKTYDDVNFREVLNTGHGVYFVHKLGNKLFAGGISAGTYQSAPIYMSEDEGESWVTVYTTSPIHKSGASNGFRYMSKGMYAGTDEEQIIAGNQTLSRHPLRILEGGDNWYSQILVDIPSGVSSLTIESGYLISNEKDIYNDSISIGDRLLSIPLNENSEIIKIETNGVSSYISKGFEYMDMGKKLGSIYPFITKIEDRYSAIINEGEGLTAYIDLTEGDISIGFWFYLIGTYKNEHRMSVIRKNNQYLRLYNAAMGKNTRLVGHGGSSFSSLVNSTETMSMARLDINLKQNGDAQVYANGILKEDSTFKLLDRKEWKGEVGILAAEIGSFAIQGFEIINRAISPEEAKSNYESGLFDNMEVQ